jgi:hypothetical protein
VTAESAEECSRKKQVFHDERQGPGDGFASIFPTRGASIKRVGRSNDPWIVAGISERATPCQILPKMSECSS